MRPAHSTTAAALAAALVLLTVAGCSSTSSAVPSPSSTALAPPITQDQLSVAAYTTKPCDLLQRDQLAHLGVTTPGTPNGSRCRWTPADTTRLAFEAGVDVTSGGMEQLYRRRSSFPMFIPTEVSGYPAVNTASSAQAPRQGQCTVRISVATAALVIVTVAGSGPAASGRVDACHEVDLIALSVMAIVKQSSP